MPDEKKKFPPIEVEGSTITIPDGARVKFVSPAGVLRLQENGVKQRGEGGRVAFAGDNTEDDTLTEEMKITAVSFLLNFRKDKPMLDYPEPVEDGGRRYSVVLIEHDPPA